MADSKQTSKPLVTKADVVNQRDGVPSYTQVTNQDPSSAIATREQEDQAISVLTGTSDPDSQANHLEAVIGDGALVEEIIRKPRYYRRRIDALASVSRISTSRRML